ncbi:MAG: hypothetical protein ACE148_03205 [Vicinamibacterales bacterium]
MSRLAACVAVVSFLWGGCGGGGSQPATKAPEGPENRWLRGLSATDVKKVAESRGLVCEGPRLEGGTSVWTCQTRTPLVSYMVRFYGSAPLKIEYVTATITQSGPPKEELVAPLFVGLAGLHFEGSDAPKARAWTSEHCKTGGTIQFGPAKFRIHGDLGRLTLDIKAAGSDW